MLAKASLMNIEVGHIGMADMVVSGADLATVLNQQPNDGFPPVLATARMIGLMELAGSRALHPALADDQLSVGVSIEVAHTAATPIGVKVSAEAKFTGMDGKLFVFEVVAHDSAGEIGRGTHKRALVSSERLLSGAIRRCSGNA